MPWMYTQLNSTYIAINCQLLTQGRLIYCVTKQTNVQQIDTLSAQVVEVRALHTESAYTTYFFKFHLN